MNSTQKKTLILSNSSLPHIEESESFKKAIKDNGFEAEIFIIDNGEHETRTFGFKKLFQLLNIKRVKLFLKIIRTDSISSVLLTAPIPIFMLLIPFIKYRKVKIHYTFHEPHMPERKSLYYLLSDIYHFFLIPQVDNLLFYSKNALSFHKESRRNSSIPCHVVPLYKYRDVIEELPHYRQRKYISFIGNVGSNKDLNKFFEIAERLPNNSFLLAGSGELTQYQDQVDKLKNLTVINRYLSEQEYFSYLDQSKYVLLPYSSASQSGVLLDVMCRGGIAVCTDIKAFTEVISHMKTGLIFSYDQFSEEFIKLQAKLNKDQQQSICLEALSLYNSKFSEEGFMKAIRTANIPW